MRLAPVRACVLVCVVTSAVTAAPLLRAQDLDQADDSAAPQALVVDVSAKDTVVVTGDELLRRGFRTLGDALVFELGVVRERGGRGLRYSVFGIVSGMALMVDGVPQQLDGERALLDVDEMVNLADVQRVEIVRGPASSLAGAGALTGVVRVFTRTPGTTGARARVSGSAFVSSTAPEPIAGAEHEMSGEATVRQDAYAARASVQLRSGAPMRWRMHAVPTRFERTPGTTLPVSATDLDVTGDNDDALLSRATVQAHDVVVDVAYRRTLQLSPISSVSHGLLDDPQQTRREQLRLRAMTQHYLGPVHVEAAVTAGRHVRDDVLRLFPPGGAFADGGTLNVHLQTLSSNATVRAEVPFWLHHRVIVGAFGDLAVLHADSHATNARTGAALPSALLLNDTAVGVAAALEYQGDFAWGLHVTAGTALGWRTGFPVALAPRLGVAWDATDGVSVRAGYSEGTRTPDRFDMIALSQAVVQNRIVDVTDNTTLRPEHVRVGDVAVALAPSLNLRVAARGFVLRHEDALQDVVNVGVLTPQNAKPRWLLGGDGEARLALFAQRVQLQGGVAGVRTISGADVAADALTSVADVDVRVRDAVHVGARARALHRLGAAQRSPDAATFDAYAAFDPGAALSVSVVLHNLADANERTFDPDTLPFSPAALYPGAGRSLVLAVEGRL